MNSSVAGQLLSKVMGWTDFRLAEERPWIEFIANMKYDAYDQYMPGTRFIASLVQWLSQFEEISERQIVYDFVKKQLVFISSTQIFYLVKLLYTTKIRPEIRRRVAEEKNVSPFFIGKIESTEDYEAHIRKSLIVGLSDGAHIDILRRSAGLNNDQVLTNYYPNEDKLTDMLKELKNDPIAEKQTEIQFSSLFLIDDFTASGMSFIRKEGNNYKGKIKKVIDQLQNDQSLGMLFDNSVPIQICIFFCIATTDALTYLNDEIQKYLIDNNYIMHYDIKVDAVQIIDTSISSEIREMYELCEIARKYFKDEDEVLTKSYIKGKHTNPYLGFNECALPIVLSHNTPNNSLPILWQYTTNFKGLFPRVNRHIQ